MDNQGYSLESCSGGPPAEYLAILLDNELVKDEMYRPNTQPYDMSGAIALTKGRHEIVFDNVITMDWSVYGDNQRSYVWDLNFNLMEAKRGQRGHYG